MEEDVFKMGDISILHPISLKVLRYLTDIYQTTALLQVLKQNKNQTINEGYQEIINFLSDITSPTDSKERKQSLEIPSDIKNSVLFCSDTIYDILQIIFLNYIEDLQDDLGLSTLFELLSEWYNIVDETTPEEKAIIEDELNTLEERLDNIESNKEDILQILSEYSPMFTQAILSDLHINDYITYVGSATLGNTDKVEDIYSLNLSSDIADLLKFTEEEPILCPCQLSIPYTVEEKVSNLSLAVDKVDINVKSLDIINKEIAIEIISNDDKHKLNITQQFVFELSAFLYVYSSNTPGMFLNRLFTTLSEQNEEV